LKSNNTKTLFPELLTTIPKTQAIKYTGSKLKLLPQIISLVEGLDIKTVLDGFAGTTRVSQAFSQLGFQVTSNDISDWSYILGTCYLKNNKDKSYYKELINHLNSTKPVSGWFTEYYGGIVDKNGYATGKDGGKKPWQAHNTKKLDAIRNEIDNLCLDEIDKSVALTSLILAMDKVDSTLGHYTSYLKSWSARSFNNMELEVPNLFMNKKENIIIQDDIFNTIKESKPDFAYFDPPYGSSNDKMPASRVRYASYYHIWTTIIKNDKPEVFGKAMRRKDSSDTQSISKFEEFRKDTNGKFAVINTIDKLIEKTNAKYIAFSYSSGGRANMEELKNILSKHGKLLKMIAIDYKKNVMANMSWTNQWVNDNQKQNQEFIFLLKK